VGGLAAIVVGEISSAGGIFIDGPPEGDWWWMGGCVRTRVFIL